jgi:DNA mismatch endonuclease (patch repair protein)
MGVKFADVDPARSALMARVRTSGTGAELAVRAALRLLGVRYRLGGGGLPGRPDLCNKSRKWAIFVNGCFWHRHTACARGLPKTNGDYWAAKFAANRARDARCIRGLRAAGWRILVVWECEIARPGFRPRLARFLGLGAEPAP